MDGGGAYNPRTVEEVYRDFKGRRSGMIKALTSDVQEFYRLCDPEKENLCLYGRPDEHWEVNLPAEEVPPELPEPVLGINFARDGMQEKDWLSLVAVHSHRGLPGREVTFRHNGAEHTKKAAIGPYLPCTLGRWLKTGGGDSPLPFPIGARACAVHVVTLEGIMFHGKEWDFNERYPRLIPRTYLEAKWKPWPRRSSHDREDPRSQRRFGGSQ
ncbi:hypothetical protein F2Q68_00018840 [Brassica cretica]|uniref:PHD finger protein ALFIN-LIKE n=1 Tax=Brassica cretica TaxID=69181 RepID=A0A8S9FS65_BRACR|nr:hypothetical protein F2Q68_00018840 [Brassica cretica]